MGEGRGLTFKMVVRETSLRRRHFGKDLKKDMGQNMQVYREMFPGG